jgi:hypothetical protein
MKTRHIAFLGFTTSSFLAIALAGCSASDTTAKKPTTKDGGSTTSTGAAGSTAAGAGGMANNPTTGAGGSVITMTGGAGSMPVDPGPCTAPDKATKALVAATTLTDLEGTAPGAILNVTPGGGWYSYKDPEPGTTFIPDPTTWMPEPGGPPPSVNAVHAAGTGFVGPASATNWGAGTGFSLGGGVPGGLASGTGMATMPTDVSMYGGISFYAKSAKMSDISVQFATPDTDPSYCTCSTTMLCYTTHTGVVTAVAADWTKYTVKFSELKQPTYVMAPIPFDPTSLLTINFASNGPVDFDFWIDNVELTPP